MEKLLHELIKKSEEVLKDNLTGIYLHDSAVNGGNKNENITNNSKVITVATLELDNRGSFAKEMQMALLSVGCEQL